MEPTPQTGAITVHPNNVQNNVPPPEYSDSVKTYINFRRARMIAARDTRDMVRDEYDGMGFLKYIDVLKKADDQYLAPRKNKVDTSLNTGTIRDKNSSLLEYAMKYDFEPVAQVFDDGDDQMIDLAETGEDLVRKSMLVEEQFKAKAKLITRSMIAFGTAYAEDQYIERWSIEKQFGKGAKVGSLQATWTEKKIKIYDGCQIKLWDIRKCYPGDVRKFFMNGPQGQPFFFTVEYESYDVVKQWFGDWDRWINVPNFVVMTTEVSSAATYAPFWTLRPISMNYVEIIRYYDSVANEYAITLNGVDMLPIMTKPNPKYKEGGTGEKELISGFPLTEISPSGAIPFAKFDLEPMHEFYLSKSQTAKMRIWGDIENMFMKLMIRQLKQKIDPTMGNKSGKQFGPEVTEPAQTINDIREGDLFPILPNFAGPTVADFTMYSLVKKEIAKNSVEDSFQGMNPSATEKTATQDLNEMKSASLKVAACFDGLINGWGQFYWLRTYSIAKNWTKPVDMHIDLFKKQLDMKYRSISVPNNGDGYNKKIKFTKDTPVRPGGKPTLADSQDLHMQENGYDEEREMAMNPNSNDRIVHLHPELFANMRCNWYYTAIPVINDTDPLSYMMFAKQINDAATFFGPQSLNVKKLKRRFARITGQDYDTWFVSQQELDQANQQQAQPGSGPSLPGAPGGPVSNSPGGPSIGAVASGKVPQPMSYMK